MLHIQNKSHATKTISELENLVDEFVLLDQQISAMKTKTERHAKLKKQLASECDTFGNTEIKLVGNIGFAVFTKPSVKRTIKSVSGFINAVGLTQAMSCLSVSVTGASKLLTEAQRATLFEESVGSRRLKHCELIGNVLEGSSGATASSTHH